MDQGLVEVHDGAVTAHWHAYLSRRGIDRADELQAVTGFGAHRDFHNKRSLLILPITAPDGTFQAVHQIWFDFDGKPIKVDGGTRSLKVSKGPQDGGAVRIKGTGPRNKVLLCEGFEDAASAWLANPDHAGEFLACCGGLKRVELGEWVQTVDILADNDRADASSRDAVKTLAELSREDGLSVAVLEPRGALKDANAVLCREGVQGLQALLRGYPDREATPEPSQADLERLERAQSDIADACTKAAQIAVQALQAGERRTVYLDGPVDEVEAAANAAVDYMTAQILNPLVGGYCLDVRTELSSDRFRMQRLIDEGLRARLSELHAAVPFPEGAISMHQPNKLAALALIESGDIAAIQYKRDDSVEVEGKEFRCRLTVKKEEQGKEEKTSITSIANKKKLPVTAACYRHSGDDIELCPDYMRCPIMELSRVANDRPFLVRVMTISRGLYPPARGFDPNAEGNDRFLAARKPDAVIVAGSPMDAITNRVWEINAKAAGRLELAADLWSRSDKHGRSHGTLDAEETEEAEAQRHGLAGVRMPLDDAEEFAGRVRGAGAFRKSAAKAGLLMAEEEFVKEADDVSQYLQWFLKHGESDNVAAGIAERFKHIHNLPAFFAVLADCCDASQRAVDGVSPLMEVELIKDRFKKLAGDPMAALYRAFRALSFTFMHGHDRSNGVEVTEKKKKEGGTRSRWLRIHLSKEVAPDADCVAVIACASTRPLHDQITPGYEADTVSAPWPGPVVQMPTARMTAAYFSQKEDIEPGRTDLGSYSKPDQIKRYRETLSGFFARGVEPGMVSSVGARIATDLDVKWDSLSGRIGWHVAQCDRLAIVGSVNIGEIGAEKKVRSLFSRSDQQVTRAAKDQDGKKVEPEKAARETFRGRDGSKVVASVPVRQCPAVATAERVVTNKSVRNALFAATDGRSVPCEILVIGQADLGEVESVFDWAEGERANDIRQTDAKTWDEIDLEKLWAEFGTRHLLKKEVMAFLNCGSGRAVRLAKAHNSDGSR